MTDVLDRIVKQNLGAYREMPSRLQEDVSQEAQVANDYRGRLVYELLQNADDAMAGEETRNDRVSFRVNDNELWIANTGRALTDKDVQGLCGLGASSKVDAAGKKRASIGHKGLGFKSVLEITDEPRVYSSTHSFALGARHARPLIAEQWRSRGEEAPQDVPAMRFPGVLSERTEQWEGFARAGFNTAFCFPFRESSEAQTGSEIADLLLGLPLTTVLFLKHLEHVEIRVERGAQKIERQWTVDRQRLNTNGTPHSEPGGLKESGLYRVAVTTDERTAQFFVAQNADVNIGNHRAGLSGPAWKGVNLTEVSVATLVPSSDEMPSDWRRFHVFLPTSEPCPYPILVNGAFSTDLSRRHVSVSTDAEDYNAHLIRTAARVVCSQLIPLLRRSGAEAVLSALDRGARPEEAGSTAAALHEAIRDELKGVPILPSEAGPDLALSEAVLPPTALGKGGSSFRRVLAPVATWKNRQFPRHDFCTGHRAAIAADHGALELEMPESLTVLATCHDADRSKTVDHDSMDFELDPVLELCTALWREAAAEDRNALEEQALVEPLFPVHQNDDHTLVRESLGDAPAFYPPRTARQDLPLEGLKFMAHSICWGKLNQTERLSRLEERMKAWSSLFGVREFRFETVVQAAVLPALVLNPDDDAAARLQRLRDRHALAAVCQLAGRFAKPDRPLRYQRLQSDRALLNLSRLPVPCRARGGETDWRPAYSVYFGSDWIGDDSVERIDEALEAGSAAEFNYLASPETFVGLLEEGAAKDEASEVADDSDEVSVDEDADEAIESNERDRWIAFLSWIGVNRALRPVHFHDVEDGAAGWLTTKNLGQPKGWAFRDLKETWTSFEASVRETLSSRGDKADTVPYFYEAHDLDQIVPVLAAAEGDGSGTIAKALLGHLIRHWSWLAPFTVCQVALVEAGKSPGQRSKPQKALPEELADGGYNLWLHRLRRRSVCPTRLGPRSPHVVWMPSAELDRRFARRGRSAARLLPVLEIEEGLAPQAVRALSARLGVRAEPSPSTFGIDDTKLLCEQLEAQYGGSEREVKPGDLSKVIKPVYRQMFELLSGKATSSPENTLADAPLISETSKGMRFLPASQILYAATPGMRERSGVSGSVPTFILEAEPSATAPLTRLFCVRTLENAIEWHPDVGESALDSDELGQFRENLASLLAPLLARIRAERTRPADVQVLREFVARCEPVEELSVSCTLDGDEVLSATDRPYFVRATSDEPLVALVKWGGAAGWPPPPEAAQGLAMALADALGINLVETFLAFIQSYPDQRLRLLDIAGAKSLLPEAQDELSTPTGEESDEEEPEPEPTPAPVGGSGEEPAAPPGPSAPPAAPPVPLVSFADLLIAGKPILVQGEPPVDPPDHSGRTGTGNGGGGRGGSGPQAAPGTDLSALDALGMSILIAHETHRLNLQGVSDVSAEPNVASDSLIVDVHTPDAIKQAEGASPVIRRVMGELEAHGISRLYPGCDVLTIVDGKPDRLIELKSSGVDARVQAMSWNEWKTAGASATRRLFWLYLVGNLRADLDGTKPFVRAIHDPFGTLAGDEVTEQQIRRSVQLRVREFKEAEYLELGLVAQSPAE